MGAAVTPGRPAALTPRQRAVFEFVRAAIARDRFPPTIREIGAALGIRSTNGVAGQLAALERKGWIALGRGRSRAITVTAPGADGFTLPLLGVVPAGPGLEVWPLDEAVDLMDLFGGASAAVRAAGDGFRHDHVAAGDLLLLRPADPRRDAGRTVAAEVGGRTGLYDYLPRGGGYALSSRPDRVRVPGGPDVRVLGVLVGVVRKER